jgi:hypothetical protein
MTAPDTHEILSALLDREPVDPDRLAAVLERPEARALLVDFVRLRALLHADVGGAVPAAARAPAPRSVARPLLAVAAAALLLVTGAALGSRFGVANDDRPPEPNRVVKLVPSPPTGGVR